MKLVSVLFQAIGRISQTNKNTLSEAWNKSEKHRTRQKAKIFGCLSYSIPISQTGISQKGNFWVSGLFQGQKVSGLFCTLRGKWVSGLFYGRISGLFCGLVWLSIVTPAIEAEVFGNFSLKTAHHGPGYLLNDRFLPCRIANFKSQ
jgi:hypothetical protein